MNGQMKQSSLKRRHADRSSNNARKKETLYLVKAIDVVGQQVYNLPRGRAAHGLATESQRLAETRFFHCGTWREYQGLTGRRTDLAIDEVTDGHPHLHADPQDQVVVDVLQDGQGEGGQRQGGGVAVHSGQAALVAGLVTFKVLDYFPQQERLPHFNGLLQEGAKGTVVKVGLITVAFQEWKAKKEA